MERAPRTRVGRLGRMLREVFFGMTTYDFVQHAREERAHLETVFMVVTMGDLIGLPILPPFYSFRLLPYVVPEVEAWKRRVLRERHFTEEHEHHLHGI